MGGDAVIRLRESELHWHTVDGQVVVLDANDGRYLALNDSGSTLWPALADGCTHDQLAMLLVDGYGIQRADAERDLDTFLADLRGRGLLDTP